MKVRAARADGAGEDDWPEGAPGACFGDSCDAAAPFGAYRVLWRSDMSPGMLPVRENNRGLMSAAAAAAPPDDGLTATLGVVDGLGARMPTTAGGYAGAKSSARVLAPAVDDPESAVLNGSIRSRSR